MTDEFNTAIAAMISAGTFERYPKLKVGVVEFEVAWAPYFLARLDNVHTERAVGRKLQRFKDGLLPSDFFRRNEFMSFQEDDLVIQLRSIIGVENLATSPGSGACRDENRNTRLGVGGKKTGRKVMTALRTRS